MGGGNRLVTAREVSVRQQIENFVRTRAADDALGIEPKGAPDRFTQYTRSAFRIVFQMRGGVSKSLDRLRRRAERRLIGRQFEYLAACFRLRAFAGRIGRDIENAGVRHRSGHLQLRSGGAAIWARRSAPYSALR